MSSDKDFVEFIIEQIKDAGFINCRKMFGDYAIYSDGKVFALVCDNQLFIKPTKAGREYVGEDIDEAPPFVGAKNWFLVGDRFEDCDWFSGLVRVTANELPPPKMKKRKLK